jgi:hypothetical protein
MIGGCPCPWTYSPRALGNFLWKILSLPSSAASTKYSLEYFFEGSSIFLYGLFNKLNNPTEKF